MSHQPSAWTANRFGSRPQHPNDPHRIHWNAIQDSLHPVYPRPRKNIQLDYQGDIAPAPKFQDNKDLFYGPVGEGGSMNKDAQFTPIHLHASHHADLFDDFTRDRLPASEDIYVPPHLQPLNPEDEDDVVPDQHAAFGIQKATQKTREPAWRDLGLDELMQQGPGAPGAGLGLGNGGVGGSSTAGVAGGGPGTGGNGGRSRVTRKKMRAGPGGYGGLPR
ncbi:Apc13p protein-domain-containing protein [Sordaria brevicollis]|uniref:Apc13p protein-domain-containing protein n=1 Tax=Sordaria brevicollis TaxID=83679 RepID=A0AAE0UFP0_SORBR|nr:Apc13p protein-domain-containing protein [Sordaria brevicollis]